MLNLRRNRKSHAMVPMVSMALVAVSVYAPSGSGGSTGISLLVENVNGGLVSIAQLISQIGFVAGLCFLIASIFKFKQHKDNPTQVPVGTPLSMVAMAAALMFAGNFIAPFGQTIFGSDADTRSGVNATGLTSGLTSSSTSP